MFIKTADYVLSQARLMCGLLFGEMIKEQELFLQGEREGA